MLKSAHFFAKIGADTAEHQGLLDTVDAWMVDS